MDAGLTSLLQALPSDDAPAIISGTASLTYAMLHQAVAALETSLAPIIHPADVVGVCTPHGIELTLLVLALHARQVALAAGAQGDEVTAIAVQLVREGQIRQARAEELVRAASAARMGSESR